MLLDTEDHSWSHLGKKPCPIQVEKKVCFSKFPTCSSGGMMILVLVFIYKIVLPVDIACLRRLWNGTSWDIFKRSSIGSGK